MACVIYGVRLFINKYDAETIKRWAPLVDKKYTKRIAEDEDFFPSKVFDGINLKGGYKLFQVNNLENSSTYIVLKMFCQSPHEFRDNEEAQIIVRPTNAEIRDFKRWLKENGIRQKYHVYLVRQD